MPALLAITVLAFASAPVAHAQPDITIVTVPIGKPNNEADTTGSGAVGYNYRIGTTEVTNTQYAIFLNAVAQQSDPYGLYNASMGNSAVSGITRVGEEGNYTYTVKNGFETKPVNWVTFLDAARFCNWLTNGANADASTETGMYTVSTGGLVTRNNDAWLDGGYALPTEDEWYKAAYYNLSTETYTNYATYDENGSINTTLANYGYSVSSPYVKDPGYYPAEQNGTFNMMGNVREWTESIVQSANRGVYGGYYYTETSDVLKSSYGGEYFTPSTEFASLGFRVVQLASVPEPGTYGILGGAAALLGAIALRRRNRRD